MTRSRTQFTRVYRAANSTEAHMLRGILEQQGVPVRLIGDGLSSGFGELPMDVIQVELQVPSGFAEFARQLIEEFEQANREPVAEARLWTCAQCGELCPDEFGVCWNCHNERPQGTS